MDLLWAGVKQRILAWEISYFIYFRMFLKQIFKSAVKLFT